MAIPIAAIGAGISLLGGLFGKKKQAAAPGGDLMFAALERLKKQRAMQEEMDRLRSVTGPQGMR